MNGHAKVEQTTRTEMADRHEGFDRYTTGGFGDVAPGLRGHSTTCYVPRMALLGVQARHLRALAHHLKPIVQIGKEGVTDGVVAQLTSALLTHELVKVKVSSEAPEDKQTTAEDLAKQTSSELAQIIGNTALFYRRHPNQPKIKLPR